MRNLFFIGLTMLAASVRADDSVSVLKTGTPTLAETKSSETSENTTTTANCSTCNSNKVVYKGQRNIAPCAVEKMVNVCFCDKHVDACCNCVSTVTNVNVPVCVPPCACKETVSTTRNGRRVVYDYGKYEVVVLARRNGTVEVDYKKRLLGN